LATIVAGGDYYGFGSVCGIVRSVLVTIVAGGDYYGLLGWGACIILVAFVSFVRALPMGINDSFYLH
jgi:hypothetical protein